MTTQSVRGTHDLWIPQKQAFDRMIHILSKIALSYGFSAIDTPLLESITLFQETSGESSDIVSKEMFLLQNRGDAEREALVLRPEGTAPAVRALIAAGKQQCLPQKIFYTGPMFRYSRPQKGRLRQFHQFGLEWIGDAHPLSDVEMIQCTWDMLCALHIPNLPPLLIHTLGDQVSRTAYQARLVDFCTPYAEDFSPESQIRLKRNPLRLLDSKSPKDQEILRGAPSLLDCLTPEAHQRWESVLHRLIIRGIPFVVDKCLVRGLDYYTHTVFEWVHPEAGGALLAGGRYDGLVEKIGSFAQKPTPAVGCAAGIERLLLVTQSSPRAQPMVVISDASLESAVQPWIHRWRQAGHALDWFSGPLKAGMKYAHRIGAQQAFLIGTKEWENQLYIMRNMMSGEQTVNPLEAALAVFCNEANH